MSKLRRLFNMWHGAFEKRTVRRDVRVSRVQGHQVSAAEEELILSEAEKTDVVAKAIAQLKVLPAEDRLSILMGIVIHVMQDIGFDREHAKEVFNDCVDEHAF
jgi:hypothetical protein